VHGFRSALRGETWFLSRVGLDLDFTFVPEPVQTSPYYVGAAPPERGWTYVPDPDSEVWPLQAGPASPFTGVTVRWLSVHPASGEGSMLVRLPAGWSGRPQALASREYLEMFVLDGSLELADGTRIEAGGYTFRPAALEGAPVASEAGAVAYVNVGARRHRA